MMAKAGFQRKTLAGETRVDLVLLTANEVSGLIKKSTATLGRWRRKGGGPPFVQIGNAVMYRDVDLSIWLEAQVRRSTSDPGRR